MFSDKFAFSILVELFTIINILQMLFAACIIYQIIYCLYFYYPLIKHLKKNKNATILPYKYLPEVSVIICAKNESENLKKYLPKVLEQNYPVFEVIVIDDYSTDNTLMSLKEMATQHKHLKILRKNNFEDLPGKKAAITAAIKHSKYNTLLFTDADCKPASDSWIKCMASQFDAATEIVLGYGPYIAAPTFLNCFIRYETYQTLFNYAGFALKGQTYMGVGRNLAYKKKTFEKIDGFKGHQYLASGDDDLLVAQAATLINVKLCLHQQAWCFSKAKTSWKAYIRQKHRHVSTASAYNFFIQILLVFNIVSHILSYVSFLLCFFEPLPFIIVLLVVRLVVFYAIYNKLYDQFEEFDLWLKFMLFDFIFIAYYFLNFKGLFRKQNIKW